VEKRSLKFLLGITDWTMMRTRLQFCDLLITPNMEGVNGWVDFPRHYGVFYKIKFLSCFCLPS
jgi:hypothetical protein